MTFRSQLAAGHIALLVVTIVTGTASVVALRTTSTRPERVARDLATDVIAVQRLRFVAEQLVATSRGYLLTGDPATLERFTHASERLDDGLARPRRRVDHLPHLFERYWQGRPRRGSLGLGLYICKQLIEAHHGTLEVTTRPAEGTTFAFTLPLPPS